jgi:hypothetical protein
MKVCDIQILKSYLNANRLIGHFKRILKLFYMQLFKLQIKLFFNVKPIVCWIWGSHSDVYEELYFLDVMQCKSLKVNRRFGWNVGSLSPVYTALHTRRQNSSEPTIPSSIVCHVSLLGLMNIGWKHVRLNKTWVHECIWMASSIRLLYNLI